MSPDKKKMNGPVVVVVKRGVDDDGSIYYVCGRKLCV